MELEVTENWKAFLDDVAYRMRRDPAEYWGKYLTIDHLAQALDGDNHWLFDDLQKDLIKEHGIKIG